LNEKNISTVVTGDLIVTHLIGKIDVDDVNEWFNGFEKSCQQLIGKGLKYKLLVDR
jgi:hypothetical protein